MPKQSTETSKVTNSPGAPDVSALHETERAAHSDEIRDFTARLRSTSERARKLLAQIAEVAYHGRGQERKVDVAYFPELYESSGLDVESMYKLLEELQTAGFVSIEEKYPFEDVRIVPCASGWNALSAISRFSELEKIPLRDLVVDLRLELLQ
jgi:hypothetical protein